MNIVQNAERFWKVPDSKKTLETTVQRYFRSVCLAVKDLCGEIFHAIIGQFITFTTVGFPHPTEHLFYSPRGMANILRSLRVWGHFIHWPTDLSEIVLILHGCFGTRPLSVSIMIQTESLIEP